MLVRVWDYCIALLSVHFISVEIHLDSLSVINLQGLNVMFSL